MKRIGFIFRILWAFRLFKLLTLFGDVPDVVVSSTCCYTKSCWCEIWKQSNSYFKVLRAEIIKNFDIIVEFYNLGLWGFSIQKVFENFSPTEVTLAKIRGALNVGYVAKKLFIWVKKGEKWIGMCPLSITDYSLFFNFLTA